MIYKQVSKYCWWCSLAVIALVPSMSLGAEKLDEPNDWESIETWESLDELREFLESLSKPVRIDPNITTYHTENDYWVPPEPLTFQDNQELQHTVWKHALKQCERASTKSSPSTECVAALTEYFVNEPVWKYSRLYYYSDPMGLLLTTYNEINRRHFKLPYSYDDYSMEQIPMWGDIFDGRLEQRKALFSKVTQDPQCAKLGSSANVGIQEDRAEQCSARELYKFAAYLDACTASLQRHQVLTSPTRSREDKYKELDRFETSKHVVLENIESATEREMAQEIVKRGLLHGYWVIEQCIEGPLRLKTSQSNTSVLSLEVTWSTTTIEDEALMRAIKKTHKMALKIAARSGDEWAIRSLPRLHGQFASDIYNKFPLLVHRHLGFDTGGISDKLDWNELRRHKAKAYLLLKDLAGPVVAEREFNPSKLQEEIDYILNGGEPGLPQWSTAILID